MLVAWRDDECGDVERREIAERREAVERCETEERQVTVELREISAERDDRNVGRRDELNLERRHGSRDGYDTDVRQRNGLTAGVPALAVSA
jgi:hypothetical protein